MTDTVTITFAPQAAGKISATLEVTTDDPKHQSVTVKLLGIAK